LKNKNLQQVEEKLYAYFDGLKLKRTLNAMLQVLSKQRQEVKFLLETLNPESSKTAELQLESINAEFLILNEKLLQFDKDFTNLELALETLTEIKRKIINLRYRDKKSLVNIGIETNYTSARICQLLKIILTEINVKINSSLLVL
jgi:DNA-directed RNA polymerase specialized sigma subunit